MYYIYVIKCTDDTLYTGIAKNLCKRITQHYLKAPQCAKYTKSHTINSIEGVWCAETKSVASKLEYFIKQLKRYDKLALLQNPELLQQKYGDKLEDEYKYIENITLEYCINNDDI